MASFERVNVGGVLIDNVTMEQAITWIGERAEKAGEPTFVVTPNVDHVMKVGKDEEFRELYGRAGLVLADGVPVLWAARYLGTPLKEKVSGSDLFPRFCKYAAERGYRLYFMGGQAGAVEKSAQILSRQYPGLQVVGTSCPPLGFEKNPQVTQQLIEDIRRVGTQVLFVGVGSPKAEKWISKNLAALGVPVCLSTGASFDMVAGLTPRAPRWMQHSGLEWLWRLMLEPRRMFRRYVIEDMPFFPLIWRQKRAKGHARVT